MKEADVLAAIRAKGYEISPSPYAGYYVSPGAPALSARELVEIALTSGAVSRLTDACEAGSLADQAAAWLASDKVTLETDRKLVDRMVDGKHRTAAFWLTFDYDVEPPTEEQLERAAEQAFGLVNFGWGDLTDVLRRIPDALPLDATDLDQAKIEAAERWERADIAGEWPEGWLASGYAILNSEGGDVHTVRIRGRRGAPGFH